MNKDPYTRLGAGRNDAEDVKNHAYFKDVNWDDVYHKKYVPDFIPELNNEFDLKYFDKFFTQQDIIDEQNEILLMKDEEMLNNEANLNKINCNHNITGHKNKNNLGKDEEKEKILINSANGKIYFHQDFDNFSFTRASIEV